ncbi:MAG: catalase, partial [Deltaproteobacteria bacterium]|nr:catalase [Deltaproteobacteria bacterium]
QGRNFSYLDTQLKRLGSPNFSNLPINAPKCPFHTLQQDGQMTLVNPKNRVNYEPNSWGGAAGGPREMPDRGFHSYAAEEAGPKVRNRAGTFADHYSQARQFYISQTPIEQSHIAAAFVFELSKVENPEIRTRMVSHLLNVDKELAEAVAAELGLPKMPNAAEPAIQPRTDLPPSPPLSILLNAPAKFEGRKLGALVTDGIDGGLIAALKSAAEKERATLELIAPTIAGIQTSDGSRIDAQQKLEGGPSVLYDAVVLLLSAEGAGMLVNQPAARDFIADAFAHAKFIAYTEAAKPLLTKVVGTDNLDEGFIEIRGSKDFFQFIQACRKLRFWERQTGNSNDGARTN